MENRNVNFSDLKLIRLLTHAVFLFVGWLVLSGLYDLFHLLLGVLSVSIVIFLNRRSYFPIEGERPAESYNLLRILYFHLWIFKEMVLSAVFVVRCVFSSSDKLRPCLFSFESQQPNDLAKVVLGNSMTLTPGTLTIDVENDRFLIHALTRETAQGLIDGPMPYKVARLFVNKTGEMMTSIRMEPKQ